MKARLLVIVLATTFAACGGGTTGTSPVGGHSNVSGALRSFTGVPLEQQPMVIVDASKDEEVLTTSVQDNGGFDMLLPDAGKPFQIVLPQENAASAAIDLVFESPSRVVADLQVNAERVDVNTVFEAKLSLPNSCTSFSSDGLSVEIEDSGGAPCTATVAVQSNIVPSGFCTQLQVTPKGREVIPPCLIGPTSPTSPVIASDDP